MAVSFVLSGLYQLVHNLTLWIVFPSDIVACQGKRGHSQSVPRYSSISAAINFQRRKQNKAIVFKLSFSLFFQFCYRPVGITGDKMPKNKTIRARVILYQRETATNTSHKQLNPPIKRSPLLAGR